MAAPRLASGWSRLRAAARGGGAPGEHGREDLPDRGGSHQHGTGGPGNPERSNEHSCFEAFERHPGRIESIPGPEILPYIYNFKSPGTKTVIPWFSTAPHVVETPPPSADC